MSLLENLRHFYSNSDDNTYSVVPFDGIQCEFKEPKTIVAIGDLQGDAGALIAILHERGLIDSTGRWIGLDTHVVLNGDLVGGHKDSRILVDLVIRLQAEAEKHGCILSPLLGNHDILLAQGEDDKLLKKERKMFEKFLVRGASSQNFEDLFSGDSLYARWFRSRNTFEKIGATLFVHAGVGPWAMECSIQQINATVRAWVKHWQGKGQKPPKSTRWTVGKKNMERDSDFSIGPLWTRNFKFDDDPPKGALKKADFEQILKKYGVKRLVIGHSPTADGRINLAHPYYGTSLIRIDTRISDDDRGQLGSLEITNGECRVRYTDRTEVSKQIRDLEFEKIRDGRSVHHPGTLERGLNWVVKLLGSDKD